ncbi:MAG TPA: hypothetical protein VGR37_05530 [Longimicrobiaceae bacterium]|nr:hypothetical protein [Longimicrobiaceae bacterium]
MGRTFQILAEIRERRLFRIFVSYLAGGWVVLGVMDQLIDRGYFPELTFRVAFIWYLVGIPACLLLGWNHGERGKQKAPPSEVALLACLAVLAAVLSAIPVSEHMRGVRKVAAAESGLDLRRLGVMYFSDQSRDRGQEHLADGLTEDLIAELERVSALDVVTRNGSAQFRGTDVSADSVARALGVGTLVSGSVEQVGDRLRVNVRLLDASGAEFRRASFERPAAEVTALRTDLAEETSRFLREWLGEEVRLRNRRSGAENPGAWALVQRAEKARKDGEALLRDGDRAGMDRQFRRADELLGQAETLDSRWAEPVLLRGHVAHRRARLAQGPTDRLRWISVGTEHAERVLGREPRNARALELRGLLRYWHYLQDVTPDPKERERLLQGAREDLEAAVRADPSLAGSHSALSHLYYQFDDVTGVVLAARRAYEEDAYLDAANEVLWRLVTGLYDLQQFTEARRWCSEGVRRFPGDHRFTECQLLMMTTPEVAPDVGRAWSLADRLASVAPEPRRVHEALKGRILAAGAIARAGMPDSARAVLQRTEQRLDHTVDPNFELLILAAHMRVIAGDEDGAIRALRRYAAVNPTHGFEHNWWWHPLRADPRFRELAGQGGHGEHHH